MATRKNKIENTVRAPDVEDALHLAEDTDVQKLGRRLHYGEAGSSVASSKVRSAARRPGGIVIPTKQNVYAYQGDYQPAWDPTLVWIDMGEIGLA